jgi:hypothetical protein
MDDRKRLMMMILSTTSLFLLVALSNHEHAKLIDAFTPICPSNKIQSPQQLGATSRTRKIHSTFQTSVLTTASSTDILTTSRSNGGGNHRMKTNNWFPVKPVDALSPSNGYDTLVKSAYLRHILVSSEDMANLIMDIYLKGGQLTTAAGNCITNDYVGGNVTNTYYYGSTDGDVFTRLANDVSLCIHTREDGGKIGWVDNPNNNDNNNIINSNNNNKEGILNSVVHDRIDPNVIQCIFAQRVKGGDVLKLPATIKQEQQHDTDHNYNVSGSTMWHIIRVDDLYIDIQPSTMIPTADATTATTTDIRSKNVINRSRNKLKGVGTIPLSPTFSSKRYNNDGTSSNINMVENDGIQSSSKTIYTVPNAKYYKIVTTGCQMNVADSERIMGILENELGLQSLEDSSSSSDNDGDSVIIKKISTKKTTTATPDILLLNTCTSKLIRHINNNLGNIYYT